MIYRIEIKMKIKTFIEMFTERFAIRCSAQTGPVTGPQHADPFDVKDIRFSNVHCETSRGSENVCRNVVIISHPDRAFNTRNIDVNSIVKSNIEQFVRELRPRGSQQTQQEPLPHRLDGIVYQKPPSMLMAGDPVDFWWKIYRQTEKNKWKKK